MTYCVGMLLDTGLVFLSDSRTNAGVDQISTFRKATVFQKPGDRVLVLQSSGNLAITQTVISILKEDIDAAAGIGVGASGSASSVAKVAASKPNLMNVPNLFEAARCVGGSAARASPTRRRSLERVRRGLQREPHAGRADQG